MSAMLVDLLGAWSGGPSISTTSEEPVYLRQFSNEARRIMAAMIRFLVVLLSVGSYALILPTSNKPAALPEVVTKKSSEQVVAEPVEPVATEPVEPVAEPVEPVATEPVEPVAEPVEPVATEPAEPVAEPVEPAATEPVEPVAEPVEPVATEPVEPVAEPVEPAATEPVEPVAEPVEPVATEPVEPVAEPVEPVATEPVEPVAEPVEPAATEPVEPVAEPVEPVVAEEDEERVPEVLQDEKVDLDEGENDPNAPWNHLEKNPMDTEEFSNISLDTLDEEMKARLEKAEVRDDMKNFKFNVSPSSTISNLYLLVVLFLPKA